MTRREDLLQFFISANSSQEKRGFNLDKYVDDYLIRNPISPLVEEKTKRCSCKGSGGIRIDGTCGRCVLPLNFVK